MKTMCPPSYHHNGFVASCALAHVPQVHGLPQSYFGDNREGTLLSCTWANDAQPYIMCPSA